MVVIEQWKDGYTRGRQRIQTLRDSIGLNCTSLIVQLDLIARRARLHRSHMKGGWNGEFGKAAPVWADRALREATGFEPGPVTPPVRALHRPCTALLCTSRPRCIHMHEHACVQLTEHAFPGRWLRAVRIALGWS